MKMSKQIDTSVAIHKQFHIISLIYNTILCSIVSEARISPLAVVQSVNA